MRKLLIIVGLLMGLVSRANASFDDTINAVTAPLATAIGNIVFFKVNIFGAQLPLVVLWLVAGAVFFTIYMKFINVRGFKQGAADI